MGLKRTVSAYLGFGAIFVTAIACFDACDAGRPGELGSGTVAPALDTTCARPNSGCGCSPEGATTNCGGVKKVYGDYITCSIGHMTCASGRWGACSEETVTTQSAPTLHLNDLGSNSDCTSRNPCDPHCQDFTDSPTGIDAGVDSGLALTDAGISLSQTITSPAGVTCTGMAITPSPSTLTVTQMSPVSPSTATFTASLTPSGCYAGALTPLWSIDRVDIAQISASGTLTLVSPIAGPITVRAFAGSYTAVATLNIAVNVVDVSAAPVGYNAASFPVTTGTAETSGTFAFLYPYDKTVFPLGLLSPLVQWSNGTVANAVKVTLRYPASGTTIFSWSEIIAETTTYPTASLSAKARAQIAQNAWVAFEHTAQGASGHDGILAVQRITGGATLRAEQTETFTFATDQLKGSVYYQSYGTNLVQNFGPKLPSGGFGAATLAIKPGASAPTVVAGSNSNWSSGDYTGCRVCHSASADGSKLTTNEFTVGTKVHQYTNLSGAPVDTVITNNNDGRMSWAGIYPDGSMLFANGGVPSNYSTTPNPGGLEGSDNGANASALYSLVSGSLGTAVAGVSGLPAGLKAATPVFSPDGTRVAFNHYASTGSIDGAAADKRSLAMLSYNPATKTFSSGKRLATIASPKTAVWPTFLPGNEGVVFERENVNDGDIAGSNHHDFGGTRSGCDDATHVAACGDDGAKGEIQWVNTSGAASVVSMNWLNGKNASGTLYIPTGGSSHTAGNEPQLNFEPTVNPQARGGYYWVVFTSRRLYGNVATVNPWWSDPRFRDISVQPTPKKLWVAAISSSPAAGADPSYPAFYLPGQELLAGNSKAYWVLDACKAASNTLTAANVCSSNLDCCGAPSTAVCQLDPPPLSNPATLHCVPTSSSSCVALGSVCTTDSQCCGYPPNICASGTCQTPPPLIYYYPSTFTRDYNAVCPSETRPVWRLFEWQATVPSGTSINFTAQTADTQGALPAATSYAVGTASTTVVAWTAGASTVDQVLTAAAQKSRAYLRVTATLNPSADHLLAPTLANWRQSYDCVPSE